MLVGVPREIVIKKKHFLNFARRAMLALAVLDSGQAAPLGISLRDLSAPYDSGGGGTTQKE
jgi:hypothetical protein